MTQLTPVIQSLLTAETWPTANASLSLSLSSDYVSRTSRAPYSRPFSFFVSPAPSRPPLPPDGPGRRANNNFFFIRTPATAGSRMKNLRESSSARKVTTLSLCKEAKKSEPGGGISRKSSGCSVLSISILLRPIPHFRKLLLAAYH
jgi:hypothetical protein